MKTIDPAHGALLSRAQVQEIHAALVASGRADLANGLEALSGANYSAEERKSAKRYAESVPDLRSGDLEEAMDAVVSMGAAAGAYVLAWKWVPDAR